VIDEASVPGPLGPHTGRIVFGAGAAPSRCGWSASSMRSTAICCSRRACGRSSRMKPWSC